MEEGQKAEPVGSTSTDDDTPTQNVSKEGISLRSRSVNRLIKVSPKKGKSTKILETLNQTTVKIKVDNPPEETHADSKEMPMDCEEDLDTEKEQKEKNTSMTEDFVIVIEPEKSSASSTSPIASTSKDVTNENIDTSTKTVNIGREKMKDSGLKIKSVYSLRNRSNRINWSHALADTTDMLDDDSGGEQAENNEDDDEEVMDAQVGQPEMQMVVQRVVQPEVQRVVQRVVQPEVQMIVQKAVQPAVQAVVRKALQPAVQRVVHPAVQTLVQPAVQPLVIAPVPEVITPPIYVQNHPKDLQTEGAPAELYRTENRKFYTHLQATGRNHLNQKRSIEHFDADDVIVIEDVPEVTWVQNGRVVLPGHHGKTSGSRKLGTLRALLAYFSKRAPPARRLYSCTKCRMGFSVHSDWLKHRRECDVTEVNENSLIYYCNRCPSSFTRHRDWVAHRKSHTVVTPKWMCDRCFKKFTSRRDLRDHRLYCRWNIETPTNNKPQFQCKVCDKSFPYPSALKVHSETHVLKHKCPICDVPFTRFYEMTKHVRSDHPDVETHPCEHCGKLFDRLTMLYRHMSDGECPKFQNEDNEVTVIS